MSFPEHFKFNKIRLQINLMDIKDCSSEYLVVNLDKVIIKAGPGTGADIQAGES
jgi:hypothetical protein